MKAWVYVAIILAVIVGFILVQLAIVKYNGTSVSAPQISRDAIKLGSGGTQLKYVVLGDSTALSQGGDYVEGYAMEVSKHLAKAARVTLINYAISGATSKDVAEEQLPGAVVEKPDIALIAVGANDVTHLSRTATIEKFINQAIDELAAANCNVKIILTGSADMGSVPRFPQPLRWLAGKRTEQLNTVFERIVEARELTFAPIAKETGPVFRANTDLFAADKFHPTNEGYDLWSKVVNTGLDEALTSQPSHCD